MGSKFTPRFLPACGNRGSLGLVRGKRKRTTTASPAVERLPRRSCCEGGSDVERLAVTRAILLSTGTELLLGDVQEAHLSFIAREIFPLGLRIAEQRTVPDGLVIRDALIEIFPRSEIVFVTGGLGPTTDDLTCEIAADVLGLELIRDERVMAAILERFAERGLKLTPRIERQALIPKGAQPFLNKNGTAPGIYLRKDINPRMRSPHLVSPSRPAS